MKIWLDDMREAPPGWVRVHTVEELIGIFSINNTEQISLDHDLGDGLQTGYDFLRWLEAQAYINNWKKIPEIKIHSANPVGMRNMRSAINGIERILEKNVSGNS